MGFDYKKYKEITKRIDELSKTLKKQNKENYMSFKAKDTVCLIISEANRLNAYIRHNEDK